MDDYKLAVIKLSKYVPVNYEATIPENKYVVNFIQFTLELHENNF